MKTLQEHYTAIKNGQGNKAQFLKHARSLFPEYFNQYTDFDTATNVLKSKQIINEAAGGVVSKGFDIWDWKKILAEEVKAEEKETSKEVLDYQKNAYDNKNMKNADNVNFNEIMKGFYCEMKDPANKDKTGDEIKAMVVKNLAKDALYYTKDGEFGVKGVGYTTEAPGLGEPKAPKGKHKSSGYGELKENKEKRELSLQLVDKEDKKGLALYKNTKDQNDLYYYDGKVLYSIRDDGSKGPSVRMSLFNITGLKENTDEALYQGTSITPGGGNLGGRRFIPRFTALSRDAIDSINAKGIKRVNWEKPHIKVVKSGDGVKLLVSKLLLDTIVGSERGRSKLSLAVSKMGTGITPEEMSELTGEFKKLVKVLSASGKLTQNGDYFLLDVDTKYNEKSNQYEMPLPNQVTESILRSLIQQIIKEELNKGSIEINGKTVKTYTQNGDKSYNVTYDDGTKDRIAVSNDAWDEINTLHQNATKN